MTDQLLSKWQPAPASCFQTGGSASALEISWQKMVSLFALLAGAAGLSLILLSIELISHFLSNSRSVADEAWKPLHPMVREVYSKHVAALVADPGLRSELEVVFKLGGFADEVERRARKQR